MPTIPFTAAPVSAQDAATKRRGLLKPVLLRRGGDRVRKAVMS